MTDLAEPAMARVDAALPGGVRVRDGGVALIYPYVREEL